MTQRERPYGGSKPREKTLWTVKVYVEYVAYIGELTVSAVDATDAATQIAQLPDPRVLPTTITLDHETIARYLRTSRTSPKRAR
jgi:hypothetical protein